MAVLPVAAGPDSPSIRPAAVGEEEEESVGVEHGSVEVLGQQ